MTMPTSDGEINQEIPDVYRRQIEWSDSHAFDTAIGIWASRRHF